LAFQPRFITSISITGNSCFLPGNFIHALPWLEIFALKLAERLDCGGFSTAVVRVKPAPFSKSARPKAPLKTARSETLRDKDLWSSFLRSVATEDRSVVKSSP
jgi:hypothetical protein